MSAAFIPKSLANQIAPIPILCIYAAAHRPTSVPDPSGFLASPKTNHWVLYLATSQAESIRLDPSPGANNNIVLIVSGRNYQYSNNAVKIVQLDVVANLTVGNLIEYLQSSNYIRYRFSTGGHGCRYWIYSVVSLLRSAAYIVDDSQVEDATAALQLVWDVNGKAKDEEQSGIIAGTFY